MPNYWTERAQLALATNINVDMSECRSYTKLREREGNEAGLLKEKDEINERSAMLNASV